MDELRSPSMPSGWEFWTVGERGKVKGFDSSWALAFALKERREVLRPDLFVRVSVVWPNNVGAWWILRREEPKGKAA